MGAKIVQGLLRIAFRIGRWLIKRLAKRGLALIAGYMDGKIEDFGRRLAGARKRGEARRVRWLEGRIDRWKTALVWLQSNSDSVAKVPVQQFCRASQELAKLPLVAKGELDPCAPDSAKAA